jgi:hypothetical protein
VALRHLSRLLSSLTSHTSPATYATHPSFSIPSWKSCAGHNDISTRALLSITFHDSHHEFTSAYNNRLATMSGRLITARLQPLAQRVSTGAGRHFHHYTSSSAGGLLRSDAAVRAARRQIWPVGNTPFSNAVAVRNASFMRILPQLLLKFARIPALFGGVTIAGLAYVQYQATRKLHTGY